MKQASCQETNSTHMQKIAKNDSSSLEKAAANTTSQEEMAVMPTPPAAVTKQQDGQVQPNPKKLGGQHKSSTKDSSRTNSRAGSPARILQAEGQKMTTRPRRVGGKRKSSKDSSGTNSQAGSQTRSPQAKFRKMTTRPRKVGRQHKSSAKKNSSGTNSQAGSPARMPRADGRKVRPRPRKVVGKKNISESEVISLISPTLSPKTHTDWESTEEYTAGLSRAISFSSVATADLPHTSQSAPTSRRQESSGTRSDDAEPLFQRWTGAPAKPIFMAPILPKSSASDLLSLVERQGSMRALMEAENARLRERAGMQNIEQLLNKSERLNNNFEQLLLRLDNVSANLEERWNRCTLAPKFELLLKRATYVGAEQVGVLTHLEKANTNMQEMTTLLDDIALHMEPLSAAAVIYGVRKCARKQTK